MSDDRFNSRGHDLHVEGFVQFGQVAYYNSLNLWMNKPSMTSSQPSSVVTSSYASNHRGHYGYRSDKVLEFERYNRWRSQGLNPSASNVQFASLQAKPVAVLKTQAPPGRPTATQTPEHVFRYRTNDILNRTRDVKAAASSTSTFLIQRQHIAKDVSGPRDNSVYVTEQQHRMTRLPEERDGYSRDRLPISEGRLLIPSAPNGPVSVIDSFPTSDDRSVKHRLKEEAVLPGGNDDVTAQLIRGAVQVDKRVPEDTEGLYAKINPSAKTRIKNQVNSNANPLTGVNKDCEAVSKNSNAQINSGPTFSGCQTPRKPKDSPSPPRSRLPRTDISSPSFSLQRPERSENSPLPPPSQVPLADSGRATPAPSQLPQPLSIERPSEAQTGIPRTKPGRNQGTVGHRMLRDVIKGKDRFDHQTPPRPIEEKNVVQDVFRFLDEFEE